MAANDQRWVSTTGDLTAAASWSPAEVPTAGDSLFFDGTSNADVSTNPAGLTGIDFDKIWFQSDYEGDIGSDGAYMTLGARRIIHNGSGSLYHSYEIYTGYATNVVIDSPNAQDAYTLYGNLGEFEEHNLSVHLIRGGAYLNAYNTDAGIDKLTIGTRGNQTQPIVSIGTGMGDINHYVQSSGTVTTKCVLGTGGSNNQWPIVDGGVLVVDKTVSATWGYLLVAGGVVDYRSSGNIGTCIVASGVLDMTKDSRAKTITNLTIMPGGEFMTHPNITVSNLIDLRGTVPILP